MQYACVVNIHMVNPSENVVEIKSCDQSYLIPPLSSFIMSDFNNIQKLLEVGKQFDVLVIDPPWENKSVKRSKSYNYIPEYDLKKIPVPHLLRKSGFVMIWVTNKLKYIEFVKSVLFPHWNLKFEAHWFWMKLTSCGEFVFPIDSVHKKPFESVLIGRTAKCDVNLPTERFIASVEIKQHSRKPNLKEIIDDIVNDNYDCLELFARNLTAGWTSWGNEVLKFQNVQCFDKKSEQSNSEENVHEQT